MRAYIVKKADTRKLLLDATLELMSEKGYLRATTREIARVAGVTELTLFRHFGSKEKLFEEVLKSYTFLPRLKELLPRLEGLEYEEALELIATRFLLALKERKAMVKILYSEVTVYPDKIRAVYNRFIDEMRTTLAGFFETKQKQGLLQHVSPHMAARVFLWILVSYFRSEEIMSPGGMKKRTMQKNIHQIITIFANGTMNDPAVITAPGETLS